MGSDGGRVCEGNINLESKKESISRYMFWTVALVYYKKYMILILSLGVVQRKWVDFNHVLCVLQAKLVDALQFGFVF